MAKVEALQAKTDAARRDQSAARVDGNHAVGNASEANRR